MTLSGKTDLTSQIRKLMLHILLLPAHPLFLEGGARPPGASFLLAGGQILLLTHCAAAPRLTAVARCH